jgi:hypothetical protein
VLQPDGTAVSVSVAKASLKASLALPAAKFVSVATWTW